MNTVKTLQKIIYHLAFDKTLSYYYSFFIKNLSMNRPQMEHLQNALVNRLVNHAYSCSPFYRSVMDNSGLTPEDIKCKDDLRKLPILTKSIMREHLGTIKTSGRFGKRLVKDTSSGSTGNQAILYKSPYYRYMSNAALLRCFYMTGWDRYDKSVWLWNNIYEEKKLHEKIAAKTGTIINRIMVIDTVTRQENSFYRYAKKIDRFAPGVIFGNARIILEFAKFMLDNSILFPSIRLVVTSVEQLDGRHLIAKAFNSPVFDLYSSRECYGIAVEIQQGIFATADDHVAINIYENNKVILTALHSYGFPLINYQIGDKAESLDTSQTLAPIISSLPFNTISLKIGRISEDFITKDGTRICASALMTNIASLELNAAEQQIVQTGYTDFTVNYVPCTDINPEYEKIVLNILRKFTYNNCSVIFKKVNEIPPEKSGKKLLCKRTFDLEK